MPLITSSSTNYRPTKSASSRHLSENEAPRRLIAQSIQSKGSNHVESSDGDSQSVQIIVDDSKSVTGRGRSYWHHPSLSEVSPSNRLDSLSLGEEPDWMKEPPDQTGTIHRAHRLNLSAYKYQYPDDKKKSNVTNQPANRTSGVPRRAKAEVTTKDSKISLPRQTPSARPPHQLAVPTNTELEAGEVLSENHHEEPAQQLSIPEKTNSERKPDRSVYLAPHQRRKSILVEHPAPHKPTSKDVEPPTPDLPRHIAPHLRTQATAAPSQPPSTNLDESSSTAGINTHLLNLLKSFGVEGNSDAVNSIKDILAKHQLSSSTAEPSKPAKDPKAQMAIDGLALNTDQIVTRSYESLSMHEPGQSHDECQQAADWSFKGVDSLSTSNGAIKAPVQSIRLSEETVTVSPTCPKGKNPSRPRRSHSDDERRGQMNGGKIESEVIGAKKEATSVANGGGGGVSLDGSKKSSRNWKKVKLQSNGGNSKQAGGGAKVPYRNRGELEDWGGRPAYCNFEERNAAVNAFAQEQADNLPAANEIVDTTSPEFQNGLAIIGEDEEDIIAEKMRDKEEPRKADSMGQMIPLPHQSTSNDRAKAYMTIDKDHPMAAYLFDMGQEMKKMSKKEKREIMLFNSRPNPHAPEANIYLRPAETGDASQINEIWNHHVEKTINVGFSTPWAPSHWPGAIRQDDGVRLPFLVAVLKHGNKRAKRQNNEHIVGFGRAIPHGDETNAFRFSVELEIFVRDQNFRKGIGKTLFDRLMAAVAGSPYYTKSCAPMIGADDLDLYDNGRFRTCRTILVSIFHDGKEDESLKWKEKFLEDNDFEKAGCIAKYAFKFGKFYDMTQYYFHTNLVLSPRLHQ